MEQVSRRTGFNGSALIRLLSRLSNVDAREPAQPTADRLSQWFGWTDAISLSAALDGAPATPQSGLRAPRNNEESECQRVKTALATAIAEDNTFGAGKDAASDFTPYKRRYLARQQAMEAGASTLRGKLRAAMAAKSPAMARLASVDVVMAQVLEAREYSLLSAVPGILERHFERLRKAAEADASETDDTPHSAQPTDEWLDVFRKDAQDVLLAELDFRFQPVEGLLDALRTQATRTS
ncbi:MULTISPECIES: DUF3348 domain-containing protein [unclassified Variovorax]|jgi:hypothetical protein|uniref:DUF3348 domain-containing protein n=1 Tax=unclassified Variovorax TaxID=663243 RepID=UPI000F7D6CD9|nr:MULTISPECIES: DUF3348 domain-containing protein [unclassified Variovorax]RSZ47362.1 DUF3348 domain-containing protein [Variovorax sp. 553]RSZ48513.1 DUF3348 domain-containing protein [Variovorax sp. 679]